MTPRDAAPLPRRSRQTVLRTGPEILDSHEAAVFAN